MTFRKIGWLMLLLVFGGHILSAQQRFAEVDFSKIDNKANQVHGDHAGRLAQQLTESCRTDLEKVRAIFRWITENIGYDVQEFHQKETYAHLLPARYPIADSLSAEEQRDERIVQHVLAKKAAVCSGYANLFKKLCSCAGIRAVVVEGYGKDKSTVLKDSFPADHAWNLVLIDGQFYPIDACWASGYCNAGVTKFTKAFNDYYFLTPPAEFILDHYPTVRHWSLLRTVPSLQEFFAFPEVLKKHRAPFFYNLQPQAGFLEAGVGDTLLFSLFSPNTIRNLSVSGITGSNAVWKNDYYVGSSKSFPPFEIAGRRATVQYVLPASNIVSLDIILNDTPILRYYIRRRS